MNTMDDNMYTRDGGDEREDSHRSSSHHKSKKKKKSSKRSSSMDESFDESERLSSSRTSDDDQRERKKKSKKKSDGNLSPDSERDRSSRSKKGSSGEERERKSSRKHRDGDHSERKSSRKKRDDAEEDEEDDRKPPADPDYRSSRSSRSRRSEEESGDRKRRSKPYKTEDSGTSRSTAAASSTLGADLENQMAQKRRPAGPRPTRPGAVSSESATSMTSSNTASNLSQFEQDVQAKNRARRSAKPASAPGVVRESTGGRTQPSATAALNQLEQDAMAKSRAARTSGAVASTGGSQYGKASGRSSRASASSRSSAAAAAGAPPGRQYGGKTTGLDDPQPISASQRATLQAVEDELASKSRSVSANSTVIEPGGRARSGRSSAAAYGEAAVVGGTVGGAAYATASREPSDTALSQLENDVMSKPRRSSIDTPIEPQPMTRAPPEPAPVPDNDYMDSFAVHEPMVQNTPPLVNGDTDENETSSLYQDEPGQTAEIYPGVDFGSQEFATEGAVEAFVADNVVDAMGVAVVMSEEEENQLERRKYKKYLIIAFICMVLIAVAIVVPVVLVVGNVEPAPPSAEPSSAPSMAPSTAPTSGRLDATVALFTPISGEEAMQDTNSPQYQAARWVSDEDPLGLPLESPQYLQRYVLAVFYFSTNGDDWMHCGRLDPICGGDPDEDSWLSESSECIWLGNRCTDGVNVDRIFFARTFGNNLDGFLPPELTSLPKLESLILQNNFIQGTIPEFLGDISLLNTLILSGNPMEGSIPEIMLENAPLLGTIHLSRMNLNGTVPTELAALPLTDLRLDENELTGPIPAALGSVAGLRILELQFNMLSDVLPVSLFTLPNLVTFRVNDNLLVGTIPATISQMVNLEEIWMNATSIGGPLPETIYTLPKLSNLNLANADFGGTLSESVSNLSNLRFLRIQNNGFNGNIPVGLDSLTRLNDLLLHGNDLVGTISAALCSRKGTNFFDLQNVTADCGGASPEVVCPQDCCDLCFPLPEEET